MAETLHTCERCGARPKGWALLDYCATCSRNLCDACMASGCCGNVPAISGEKQDYGDDNDGDVPKRPT